ncbi:MAG: alpha/beta fold hydrolase [Clostridia bacterium]|nr:alpha/beta fold hydrolase [Clostridia bacterium]
MEETRVSWADLPVCQPVDHQGNEHGVLLMHGFTGSPAHMRRLADGLIEKGYTVKSILLPGHGTSEADMAKATWQAWLQAAKEAALSLINTCETVTVCGLSMGGVLALLVAEQMKVDACVPISAPMAVQNPFLGLAGIAAPLIPRIPWGSHPERQSQMDAEYSYGYPGFPTAKGADLNRLIKLAKKNLFAIECPLLVVQSDADETIWLGSADYILDNISSQHKWKLQLSGVPHVCTITRETPAILDGIVRVVEHAARAKAEKKNVL